MTIKATQPRALMAKFCGMPPYGFVNSNTTVYDKNVYRRFMMNPFVNKIARLIETY